MTRQLAKREGWFVGVSAAANIVAAERCLQLEQMSLSRSCATAAAAER